MASAFESATAVPGSGTGGTIPGGAGGSRKAAFLAVLMGRRSLLLL